MADPKSSTPSFQQQLQSSNALALATRQLYLANPGNVQPFPPVDVESVADLIEEASFRATLAHRRGIESCRLLAVERVACALAVADGVPWPDCGVVAGAPDYQRVAARRRLRYRHVATLAIAEYLKYMEQGTETELQRAAEIHRISLRTVVDTVATAPTEPSTVVQIGVARVD